MESLARKYWKDKDKIAKLTSYGSYLDCEYITAKYPEDESHIVGDLAEYVYDLEQEVEKLTKSFAHKNNEDLSTTINGVKFTTEQIIALQQVSYSVEYDKNQTAIEELEKVKEIFGRVRWYQGSCNLGFGETKYFDDKLVSWIDVEKEIDQQIKLLKGEK